MTSGSLFLCASYLVLDSPIKYYCQYIGPRKWCNVTVPFCSLFVYLLFFIRWLSHLIIPYLSSLLSCYISFFKKPYLPSYVPLPHSPSSNLILSLTCMYYPRFAFAGIAIISLSARPSCFPSLFSFLLFSFLHFFSVVFLTFFNSFFFLHFHRLTFSCPNNVFSRMISQLYT